RRVEQDLLDGDRRLAVPGELGDVIGHPVLDSQPALAEELPHDRGHDRLGDGEDTEACRRRRRPEGLEGDELAVAGDGELAGRQPAAVHVLPGCVEQGVEIHQARDVTRSERRQVTDRTAGWSTTDLFGARTGTSHRPPWSHRRWGSCGRRGSRTNHWRGREGRGPGRAAVPSDQPGGMWATCLAAREDRTARNRTASSG